VRYLVDGAEVLGTVFKHEAMWRWVTPTSRGATDSKRKAKSVVEEVAGVYSARWTKVRPQRREPRPATSKRDIRRLRRHKPAGSDAFGVGDSLPVPRIQTSLVPDKRHGHVWYLGIVTHDYANPGALQWIPIEWTLTWSLSDRPAPREAHCMRVHAREHSRELGLPAFVVDEPAGVWAQLHQDYSVEFGQRGAVVDGRAVGWEARDG